MESKFLSELINRPIIRNDYAEEFMNKMTDAEIKDFEHDIKINLIKNKIPEKFPDWNVAYLSAMIDQDVLYQLLKLGKNESKKGI